MIACNKKIFDNRNQYVGTWEFETAITEQIQNVNSVTEKKEVYEGEISYKRKDGFMSINYSKSKKLFVKVDNAGKISSVSNDQISGAFTNVNTLEMDISWNTVDGKISHHVIGHKK